MKRRKIALVLTIILIICILSSNFVFASAGDTETGYRIKPLLEKLASLTQKDIDSSIDSFTDVRNNWSKQYVGKLTQLEIISGYGNGKFGPQYSLRINEFIKMIVLAMGFTPERGIGSKWAEPYINIAINKGIIGKNEFPDYTKEIKRQEMAKILYLAAMKKEAAPDSNLDDIIRMNIRDFSDIDDIYAQDVISCYRLGLLRGTPEYFFQPKKTLTRAEGCVVIINYLDVTARNPFTKNDNYAIVLNNYARERELVGDDTGDNGKGVTYTLCRPDRKEEMKVANVLKDSLSKSKGYGFVMYNETEYLITSSFYESGQRFYEDLYEMHIGLTIYMRDDDPVTYAINVSRPNKAKELHWDVAVEFLKAIFDKDAQKAIAEFDKRLDASIKGIELKEEWITVNNKPVRLGATGYEGFMIDVWKYKP